jgi:hypothetical protein
MFVSNTIQHSIKIEHYSATGYFTDNFVGKCLCNTENFSLRVIFNLFLSKTPSYKPKMKCDLPVKFISFSSV